MKRLLIAFSLLLIPSAHAVDYVKCDAINRLGEKVVKEMYAGGERLVKSYKFEIEQARRKIAQPYCEDAFGSKSKNFLSCMGWFTTYDIKYLDYVNLDNFNPKIYEEIEPLKNSSWKTHQSNLKRLSDRYLKKLTDLRKDYLEEGCP
jgi:hypothetical protein